MKSEWALLSFFWSALPFRWEAGHLTPCRIALPLPLLPNGALDRSVSFFRDISIAFQVLKDEEYRYLYNRFGLTAVQRHQIAW